MHPNTKNHETKKLITGLIALSLLATATALAGPKVLLLWDTQGVQTENLKHSLEANSLEVVLSQTNETGYDGTNPPLAGFDVVVHLNGTTYNAEMNPAGQKALVQFVKDGGGYIHHEWNAYQLTMNQMALMRDLILFDRTSGYSGKIVVTRLKGQNMHPVVWEIPPGFEMNGGCNIGKAHKFEQNPVTVLAADQNGNDAIAVRDFGLGRIVGFHHGGNWGWSGEQLMKKREARRLFVDAVMWAHGCGPAFAKGERKQVCAQIAKLRASRIPAEAPLKVPVK